MGSCQIYCAKLVFSSVEWILNFNHKIVCYTCNIFATIAPLDISLVLRKRKHHQCIFLCKKINFQNKVYICCYLC